MEHVAKPKVTPTCTFLFLLGSEPGTEPGLFHSAVLGARRGVRTVPHPTIVKVVPNHA